MTASAPLVPPEPEPRHEQALPLALLGALTLFIIAQADFANLVFIGTLLAGAWYAACLLPAADRAAGLTLFLGLIVLLNSFAALRLPLAYAAAGYAMLCAGFLLHGRLLLALGTAVVAVLFALRVIAPAMIPDALPHLPVIVAGGLCGRLLRRPQQRIAQEHATVAEYNRQIVQQMPAGLLLLDYTGAVTRINRAAAAMLNISEKDIVNRPLSQLAAGAVLHPLVAAVYREMGAVERTVELPGPAGNRRVQVRATLARDNLTGTSAVIMLLEDLSALTRMEAELQRTERLASVGQLAASVAHEINNPVGGVIGYVRTCLEEGTADRDDLAVILRGVEKIPPAVKKLLDLTRAAEHHPAPVPLAPVVRELARLHARTARVHCTVPDGLACHADPTALTQALTNLLLNALAAAGPAGTVTIGATAGPAETAVTITDSGAGIPAEHLPRIFDPFFTTRRDTGGTGLGLAMVARIMERHHGRVDVDSRPGATCFALHFPAPGAGKE
ncbi:MAG TPA: ATP-binding protein [bacterium]|nr:ATP-binding protein [bacterium]